MEGEDGPIRVLVFNPKSKIQNPKFFILLGLQSKIQNPKSKILYHSLSTQVSLLPPPCDEFTTSEPRRSATRVSPPGTRVTRSP
jgi:hypothetical protein